MENRGPVFEKSNSVENVYHLRLTALLRELVRDGGFKGAAQALDIDQRTVARSFRSGVLSRRVRTALERGLQEGEGSAAAVQRERNDGPWAVVCVQSQHGEPVLPQDSRTLTYGSVRYVRRWAQHDGGRREMPPPQPLPRGESARPGGAVSPPGHPCMRPVMLSAARRS